MVNHRFQHLGSGDGQLACLGGLEQELLLQKGNPLRRGLHPQIPPCHHQPIESLQDGIHAFHSHGALDLGNQGNVLPHLGHQTAKGFGILGRGHKAQGRKIHPFRETKAKVGLILGGEDRHLQAGIRQVDPLPALHGSPDKHPAYQAGGLPIQNLQLDGAVVNQDGVSRGRQLDQQGIIAVQQGIFGVAYPQINTVTRAQNQCLLRPGQPDLGPTEVLQQGHRPPQLMGHLPDQGNGCPVGFVVSMRKVEPGHPHPRLNHGPQHPFLGTGRPHGGHNTGLLTFHPQTVFFSAHMPSLTPQALADP